MGWVAAEAGVAESFVLGGLACVVVGIAALAWLHRRPATLPDVSAARPARTVEARPR